MLFTRKIEGHLNAWRKNASRKPLMLRGARQVGKSTLIHKIGKAYRHFVALNLERPADRRYFSEDREVKEIWEQIRFEKNLPNEAEDTLLFIDEIQELPFVIRQLRYFHEDLPGLHVVAAGSLLEFALGDVKSFPVGRIEEMTLHPLDFEEFLMAVGEESSLDQLRRIPFNRYAYDKLFALYKRYMIIGGMPEVVRTYIQQGFEITGMRKAYASVWDAYKSDIVKYAKNDTEARVLRHIIAAAPFVRDRITFAGFGASNYRSREVGEAFRALDLAMIIYLIYPTTQTAPPQVPDLTRKPRLQFLDTGLMNYASEIQAELLTTNDLNEYYRGFVVQHMISQELIANAAQPGYHPLFWVKEKPQSTAEVDLVHKWQSFLLPIEIKSGPKGSMRSLHEYIEQSQCPLAIRMLRNEMLLEDGITRNGKTFKLLNLPYFAASQLDKCIEWAAAQF